MNETKAREHFSAYYLGELDAGIKQAFERALESNAQICAEYHAFERTMKEIAHLRDVVVQVPEDLADRITARIDKQVWEQRRTEKPGLFSWWRTAALGGVAVVAVFGAFLSLKNGNMATSSLIPIAGAPVDQLFIAESDGKYSLAYQTNEKATVIVRSGIDGPEVARFELAGQRLNSQLKNESDQSALLSISVDPAKESLLVAVPGKQKLVVSQGEGTLVDLAKAIAGYYQKPVQLSAADPDGRVSWEFASTGPEESKLVSLDGNHVAVAKLKSGAFTLQDR